MEIIIHTRARVDDIISNFDMQLRKRLWTPLNVAIMFTWSSCIILTCRGITHHDVMKYVNWTT